MRSNLFAMTILVLIVSVGTVSFHKLAHGQVLDTSSSQKTPEYSVAPTNSDGRWSEDEIRRYEYEEDDAE